jgi:hypothetical protein
LTRVAQELARAHFTIGPKHGHFSTAKDNVSTQFWVHARKGIVVPNRRIQRLQRKAAGNFTRQQIVIDHDLVQSTVANGGKVKRHATRQAIVAEIERAQIKHGRYPIRWNRPRQAVKAKVQVKKVAQIPVCRNGPRQAIVVQDQVGCSQRRESRAHMRERESTRQSTGREALPTHVLPFTQAHAHILRTQCPRIGIGQTRRAQSGRQDSGKAIVAQVESFQCRHGRPTRVRQRARQLVAVQVQES